MKKLNKIIWCMCIISFVGVVITKYFNLPISKLFGLCLQISSLVLFTKSNKDLIDKHKEKKNKKDWLSKHMSIIPGSREVVLTVNSKLDKWEEDFISKINKAASEEGLKVTINSPLSEVIDNYYS